MAPAAAAALTDTTCIVASDTTATATTAAVDCTARPRGLAQVQKALHYLGAQKPFGAPRPNPRQLPPQEVELLRHAGRAQRKALGSPT